jgi:hypothetical protein
MFAPPPAAKKNETPRASQPAPARVPSVPPQPPKQQQPALKSPSLVKSQAPTEPEQNGGASTGPQQATQRTAATRAAPAPVASSPKVVTDSSVQVESPRGAARFRSLLGTNLIILGSSRCVPCQNHNKENSAANDAGEEYRAQVQTLSSERDRLVSSLSNLGETRPDAHPCIRMRVWSSLNKFKHVWSCAKMRIARMCSCSPFQAPASQQAERGIAPR